MVSGFLNHPWLIMVGRVSTLLFILASLYAVYLFFKGILPVSYRLGTALSKRKIAVFADSDDFNNLKNILVDSKLFKKKNILQIDQRSIGRAEKESLLLLHWRSFRESLDSVLRIKKDAAALIVYAPTEDGKIDDKTMKKISEHRNVIVVNFRGRLVNDVLVCMMTSSWKGQNG